MGSLEITGENNKKHFFVLSLGFSEKGGMARIRVGGDFRGFVRGWLVFRGWNATFVFWVGCLQAWDSGALGATFVFFFGGRGWCFFFRGLGSDLKGGMEQGWDRARELVQGLGG